MIKPLHSYYSLFRPRAYFFFTLTYTLLGLTAAQGAPSWRWLLAFAANLLAVGFAFVFNQVTDAPLDVLSQSGQSTQPSRNPIATGELPLPLGRLIALLLAVVTLGLFALLGWRPLLFGLLTLLLGVLYSWDGLRLKGIALLDLSEHAWLLATPLFLSSYFSQSSTISHNTSFLLLAVFFMSIFGQLSHENQNIPQLGLSHPRQSVLLRERRLVHLQIIFCLAAALTTG
jgi:4-hydroxybenzoate polyprenyltransferase